MFTRIVSRRGFIKESTATFGLFLGGGSLIDTTCTARISQRTPNFIIIFCDDMGYGDWDRGGHPIIRTPNLNRMADEGVVLTQFYSASPVCSPSRASLLTGRNYIRTGVITVLFPDHPVGLPAKEITIAKALKPLGYKSACIGKWHLGTSYDHLPLRHGFDYYYGLLYSNDMENPDLWRNDDRIEAPAEQSTLTRRYTEEAKAFIEREKDNPFFLYLPHTMPHWPRHASERFLGSSKNGIYGDVIQEIDWSTGEILETLDRLGLSENTLVVFTSDNGCDWTGGASGSKGMFRGAKGDTFEGGVREPFIARWKGHLPAGMFSSEVGSTLDLFPTCVSLAGGSIPRDRPIDGIDLIPALTGSQTPDRTIYYYKYDRLTAIRHGKWKLHLRYYDPDRGIWYDRASWVEPEVPLLYNLERDPAEVVNRAARNQEIVSQLIQLAKEYEQEIENCAENRDLVEYFLLHADEKRMF